MRLKAFNIETDAYALSRTGIDLVIRGMMRSLSEDPINCHSCMSAFDSVYFAVLALEQVYEQWQSVSQGIEGSYYIFKNIVQVYEQLEYIDLQCHHREIGYTLRNDIITGTGFATNIDAVVLIKHFFLLNYGIWWTQPEDLGFSLGIAIKEIFGIKLEDYVASDASWECPAEIAFDSRETYSDWIIGRW